MAAMAVILVAIVVTWRDMFSAGSVGISLVMIIGFSSMLTRLIVNWTAMESSIGAVARVKRFVDETKSEDDNRDTVDLHSNWPEAGALESMNVEASHQPNGETVLMGISLSVQPQQHIAICGRSGCGKTSLILCLLQMMNVQHGRIKIDGVDISTLKCEDLRSHINVIPQDSFLMPGTLRANIDPFANVSDDEIVRVLTRVRLWDIVREQGGLDKEIDIMAWPAGQRQLLCLARALTKKSKILVLDEAMSRYEFLNPPLCLAGGLKLLSVDSETEAIMQEVIDTEFKHHTVLAIRHRLEHIAKYDMVALLSEGRLVEYGKPAKLSVGSTSFAETM